MKKTTILSVLALSLTMLFPSLPSAADYQSAPAQRQGDGAASPHQGEHGIRHEKPMAWTRFPTIKTRMSGEHREAMVITVVPQNLVANRIDAFSNNLKDKQGRRSLPLEMTGARLDKPEAGGFHWLSAREEQSDSIRVASTVYYFSDRGSKNPTAMFMQQKNELEIIPLPFPREHSRYRANEDWQFLVRFNSQPLAAQQISLETSNGSKDELMSDAQGVITLHVPDDFKAEEEKPGAGVRNHGRRGADFVLATEYVEGGKTYLTGFNSSYGPDAFDQRSLVWGLGFSFLGMMGAVPLLRRRKAEKKTAEIAVATATKKNGEA
ncbi:MAG: hypothetical protein WC208_05165 [Gallionella sp.]|jgi:hypothetical protein